MCVSVNSETVDMGDDGRTCYRAGELCGVMDD